jgi:3'-5' exoribonuclease
MDTPNGKTISQFEPGETVVGFFALRKKELKTKKDGTPYLALELGDRTGRITAMLWEEAKPAYDSLSIGGAVKVMGTVTAYQDSLQISVGKIRPAVESDGVSPKDFIPKVESIKPFKDRLVKLIESINHPSLRKLLERFFGDPVWFERFCEAPGGKLWHHAYLGGLLEHTVGVAELCAWFAGRHPEVNPDLLVTGALLHDIGKMDEFKTDGFIEYTDAGRLIGHVSLGAQAVRATLSEFPDFDEALKDPLIHLILSHQGKLEQGSPVLPMTSEAMILYYADELDSKLNALNHIVERDSEPGRRWSRYVPVLERFVFMGDSFKGDETNEEE